jgi:hypothetical protein
MGFNLGGGRGRGRKRCGCVRDGSLNIVWQHLKIIDENNGIRIKAKVFSRRKMTNPTSTSLHKCKWKLYFSTSQLSNANGSDHGERFFVV